MADVKLNITVGGDAAAAIAATKSGLDAAKASATGLSTALAGAGKSAKDLSNDANKATELFRKGIGGGEYAEKAKSISDGLKIWGDTAQTTAVRQQALTGALGIGLRAVAGYATQLFSMASAMRDAGVAASAQRDQLIQLRGAYASLQTAAAGTLTVESALAVQRQVSATGLHLSNEQMRVAVETARELTAQEGGTLESNLSVVTDALSGQATAAAHLGVSARSGSEALQQLSQRLATHAPIARSAAESAEAADRGFLSLGRAALAATTPLDPLISAYNSVGHAFDSLVGTQTRYATVEEAERARDVMMAQQRTTHATQMERQAQSYHTATTAAHDLSTAIKDAAHSGDELTRALLPGETIQARLGVLRTRIATADMAQGQREEVRRAALADGTIGSPAQINTALGFSGGGSRSTAANDAKIAASQATQAARASGMTDEQVSAVTERTQRFAGDRTHRREGDVAYFTRLAAAYRAAMEESTAAADAEVRDLQRVADEQGHHEEVVGAEETAFRARTQAIQDFTANSLAANDVREAARQDEIEQMHSYTEQMSAAWGVASAEQANHVTALASTTKMAFDTMTHAVQQHVVALVDGKESAAEAGRGILHDSLMNLGSEALGKSLFYLGEGIGRAASSYGMDATAVGLFEASAVMAGVAALGLGGGALVNAAMPASTPSAASGGGGLASRPASVGAGGSDNSGGVYNYNVNITGGIIDRDGFIEAQREGWQQMARTDSLPTEMRRAA